MTVRGIKTQIGKVISFGQIAAGNIYSEDCFNITSNGAMIAGTSLMILHRC
jgi:hypothetical protein